MYSSFFYSLSGDRGFTLMELLVAMAITTMITLIIAMGFSLTIRSWEVGENRSLVDQRARIILDKISKEISSMYTYRYKERKGFTHTSINAAIGDPNKMILAFNGESDRVSFISSISPVDDQGHAGGLKEVLIYPGEFSEDRGRSIHIIEKLLDPAKPFELTMYNGEIEPFSDLVSKIKFRYFLKKRGKDASGKEYKEPGYWSDSFKDDLESSHSSLLSSNMPNQETVLWGIEVELSLFEVKGDGTIGQGQEVRYPPLTIPVNIERVVKAESHDL